MSDRMGIEPWIDREENSRVNANRILPISDETSPPCRSCRSADRSTAMITIITIILDEIGEFRSLVTPRAMRNQRETFRFPAAAEAPGKARTGKLNERALINVVSAACRSHAIRLAVEVQVQGCDGMVCIGMARHGADAHCVAATIGEILMRAHRDPTTHAANESYGRKSFFRDAARSNTFRSTNWYKVKSSFDPRHGEDLTRLARLNGLREGSFLPHFQTPFHFGIISFASGLIVYLL